MITVRPWHPEDIDRLLTINNAAVPAVNDLLSIELAGLLDGGLTTLVAEQDRNIAGFVLCMAEGLDYDSENYRWITARYPAFAYIDRVVVDDSRRGAGIGAALYDHLIATLRGQKSVLMCEVNEQPPNPGSYRFHKRHGFVDVGRLVNEGGAKHVVLMEKSLGPPE